MSSSDLCTQCQQYWIMIFASCNERTKTDIPVIWWIKYFFLKKEKKGRLSAIFFSQYVYIQILKIINTPLGISCILPAPTRKSDNINHFTVSCQLGEERKKKNTHPNLVYTARNSLLLTRLPKCSGPRLNSSWLSLIFNLQTSFSITTVYSDMNTNGLD